MPSVESETKLLIDRQTPKEHVGKRYIVGGLSVMVYLSITTITMPIKLTRA